MAVPFVPILFNMQPSPSSSLNRCRDRFWWERWLGRYCRTGGLFSIIEVEADSTSERYSVRKMAPRYTKSLEMKTQIRTFIRGVLLNGWSSPSMKLEYVNQLLTYGKWLKSHSPSATFDDRFDLYRYINTQVLVEAPITYLEFGVFKGESIKNGQRSIATHSQSSLASIRLKGCQLTGIFSREAYRRAILELMGRFPISRTLG
jgi:hypothetical protein